MYALFDIYFSSFPYSEWMRRDEGGVRKALTFMKAGQ